jgi:hypothetical protein
MSTSILLKLVMILGGIAVVGGTVFFGLSGDQEVRGDTVLDEVLPEAVTPTPDPVADYVLHLRAEDYTTYTHPTLGFSFRYPKDFDLLTATWGDEEVVEVHHPILSLSIRVSTRSFDPDVGLFAELASLPDDYEREPPEGAGSTAVGRIDADVPVPGEHRSAYWFVAHDRIFEITITSPDVQSLEAWMRKFVSNAFRLIPLAQDS